ncbi:hypothetical protein [Chromobacterium haemolyticum]|uniref:hypothetical protein n=1 Tax=Chromobacterium haemolyticum TaxID=394935 RepID=UPI0013B4515B|nr:hypothetical protein [Chromobacterium haemolyticum]
MINTMGGVASPTAMYSMATPSMAAMSFGGRVVMAQAGGGRRKIVYPIVFVSEKLIQFLKVIVESNFPAPKEAGPARRL